MPTVAIDWDGTIVDENYEWKPGAYEALKMFKKKRWNIVIHSCFANGEFGRETIIRSLREKGFKLGSRLQIHFPKPIAAYYIDDHAIEFKDNWKEITARLTKPDKEDYAPTDVDAWYEMDH